MVEDATFSASTYEFNTELRKYFSINEGKVFPNIGGGIGLVIGEYFVANGFDHDRIKDSGFNLGVNAGAKFKFHDRLTFSFDLKYSKSELGFLIAKRRQRSRVCVF